MSLRGPALQALRRRPKAGRARSASLMGSGRIGSDGNQKCPLKFFIHCGYIDYIYIYISTCISNKSCHRHSYGFQNLMSSWGVAPMKIKIPMGIWFF